MSASPLVTAAETAVDKARAARCAAEEAVSAARMAELLAREALEAAQRTLQLERRAEVERPRRPVSQLSLSSVSSCSPGPGLSEDLGQRNITGDSYNRRRQSTFDPFGGGGGDINKNPSQQSETCNSLHKPENYKQMKTKYESMSEGLNMLLRKCNNINMTNNEEKLLDHDRRRKFNVHFAELEEYDDNQNCRGLQSVKNSPIRKSVVSALSEACGSPKVYKDAITKEINSMGVSKDVPYRKIPSTSCDNCRLSGLCLHGRYLERVLPKTEGMRVRAVGAGWDSDTLGRVGQVAGGGPGGRVRIRWAWQSGVGGDAWRRLETYNLSWRGEFSFQFWCRDSREESHGRVIDLVPRN